MKYKNYEDYRAKTQKEFDSLPIFFAFSNEQFKKAMEARGLKETDTDKIYRLGDGYGGFYLKSDADIIRDYINKPDELPDLMKDKDFAISAFEYEMRNHEYAINWQGAYDVCSCFGHCRYGENKGYTDYLKEIGYSDDVIQCYKEARKRYYKYCEEHDLF